MFYKVSRCSMCSNPCLSMFGGAAIRDMATRVRRGKLARRGSPVETWQPRARRGNPSVRDVATPCHTWREVATRSRRGNPIETWQSYRDVATLRCESGDLIETWQPFDARVATPSILYASSPRPSAQEWGRSSPPPVPKEWGRSSPPPVPEEWGRSSPPPGAPKPPVFSSGNQRMGSFFPAPRG